MSAPVKTSRNRTRKAAYAAQADRSSRNENTIATAEPIDAPVVAGITMPTGGKREANAAQRRRQEGAWSRCLSVSLDKKHNFKEGINCKSCGCPKAVAEAAS